MILSWLSIGIPAKSVSIRFLKGGIAIDSFNGMSQIACLNLWNHKGLVFWFLFIESILRGWQIAFNIHFGTLLRVVLLMKTLGFL